MLQIGARTPCPIYPREEQPGSRTRRRHSHPDQQITDGSDLDGPAIARRLVVSLNTVRTHTKHIYTKLDVNNRRAAVRRAHQLGLLTR